MTGRHWREQPPPIHRVLIDKLFNYTGDVDDFTDRDRWDHRAMLLLLASIPVVAIPFYGYGLFKLIVDLT
jgi:hypothetical protein